MAFLWVIYQFWVRNGRSEGAQASDTVRTYTQILFPTDCTT